MIHVEPKTKRESNYAKLARLFFWAMAVYCVSFFCLLQSGYLVAGWIMFAITVVMLISSIACTISNERMADGRLKRAMCPECRAIYEKFQLGEL